MDFFHENGELCLPDALMIWALQKIQVKIGMEVAPGDEYRRGKCTCGKCNQNAIFIMKEGIELRAVFHASKETVLVTSLDKNQMWGFEVEILMDGPYDGIKDA